MLKIYIKQEINKKRKGDCRTESWQGGEGEYGGEDIVVILIEAHWFYPLLGSSLVSKPSHQFKLFHHQRLMMF